MEFLATILGFTLLTILAPLFLLLYFITRWRDQRVLDKDEEQEIQELWQICDRLEQRLSNVEEVVKSTK